MRENEAVLLDLGYAPGVELAPRRVDFSLVFSDVSVRSAAESRVISLGFDWQDDEDAAEPGTVEATAHLMLHPAAASITAAEISLIKSIEPLGGNVDGWGFFRDTEH